MYKQKTYIYLVLLLILCNIIFISCSNDDGLHAGSLTPQDLYQTSWKGKGHCEDALLHSNEWIARLDKYII